MNKHERHRMARLLDAVTCISNKNPLGGYETVTPSALVAFARLCDEAMPHLRRAVMAIARSDSPEEDPDAELDELETIVGKPYHAQHAQSLYREDNE